MKYLATATGLQIVIADERETLESVPADDEIRVWTIPLDASYPPALALFQCLTDDEKVRADRYKVARAQHQFVTARGRLRQLLGQCLGISPVDVPIEYNGAGKPRLPDDAFGIHFNVSHTVGLAVIAFARRPV